MRRVLVTGSTGFVGHHVVAELLERGFEVISSSSDEEAARRQPWFHRVRHIPFDLRTADRTANYFEFFHRPDLAIHLAWSGLPNYKSDIHLTLNLPAQSAFLEGLVRSGLKDLTVTGTCLEYGMKEGMLTETMPPAPANPYARAKDLLRQKLEQLSSLYGFHLKWVRLFYMYGEGQNPASILSQLEAAISSGQKTFNMSGGEQLRDYLPVPEVASNIVSIARQNRYQGVINCCSGKPVSIRELVKHYLEQRHAEMELNLGFYPYTDYEPMAFWGDKSKLEAIIKSFQKDQ